MRDPVCVYVYVDGCEFELSEVNGWRKDGEREEERMGERECVYIAVV